MFHALAQNSADLVTLLGSAVTILTLLLGFLSRVNWKNSRVKDILNAALIAEKAIDRSAYNSDGTFNEARLNMAISVLQIANPKLDVDGAKAEIESVLSKVHESLTTVTSVPQPPTNPPISSADIDPTKAKV